MPEPKTIADHARVESVFAKVRKHGVGLIVGTVIGGTSGYAAKPQTVTVPPPVDELSQGMRCTSVGDQLPDGGFVELCRPEGTIEIGEAVLPNEAPPVVSFMIDSKTGKMTHRCEQSSTGPEVCVPVDTDGGR